VIRVIYVYVLILLVILYLCSVSNHNIDDIKITLISILTNSYMNITKFHASVPNDQSCLQNKNIKTFILF